MEIVKYKLNIIPFGRRNLDTKQESFPTSWKKYQDEYYKGFLTRDKNYALITGKLPKQDVQLMVLDFDGNFSSEMYNEIRKILISYDLAEGVNQINWTGNRGFHFMYFTDTKNKFGNVQKRSHKINIFPKSVNHVDIRCNGGLIFYPPSTFSDSLQSYKILLYTPKESSDKLVSSDKFLKFFNEFYTEPVKQKMEPVKPKIETIHDDVNAIYKDRVRKMREPLRLLLLPGASDIERLSESTGMAEFLYWKALWLEIFANDISTELAMRMLEKNQRSFQYEETIHQLQYIDVDLRPFTNKKLEELFPEWSKEKEGKEIKRYRGFV